MKGHRADSHRREGTYDARYFDAELHRQHWFTNNARKRERRWREVVRMLEPASTDRVLEIGCGAGAHTLRIAPLVREIVGIDLASEGVRRAQARARSDGVGNAPFVIANAIALPFVDSSFDKVAAIDFVEHVDDYALAHVLREVRRVLRPAGRFAIYTPNASHYVEMLKAHGVLLRQIPGHVAVREAERYRRLLEVAGLTPVSVRFAPSDYPVFGALDRAFGRMPWIGACFRFRACIVAFKAAR